jgi:hypothetical protein
MIKKHISSIKNIIKNNLIKNNKLFKYKSIIDRLNKYIQNGGNKKIYKIEYKDEEYTFELLDDIDPTSKIYVLQSKNSDTDCVMLSIDTENKLASINNITTFPDLKCSDTLITNIGSHLMIIVIKLIKKYKDEFDVNKILLTDHSFLYCENIKANIILSDLYILKTGNTFYGKFGFLPYDENKNYKKLYISQYNKNKEILHNLLVKDSYLLYYLNKYQSKYTNIDISDLINLTNDHINDKLTDYITRISSRVIFAEICMVLNYIIPKLIIKNKLTSFHNKIFYLKV